MSTERIAELPRSSVSYSWHDQTLQDSYSTSYSYCWQHVASLILPTQRQNWRPQGNKTKWESTREL